MTTDRKHPRASADVAKAMDEWAALLRDGVLLSEGIGESNAVGPRPGSPYADEIGELEATDPGFPAGVLEMVTRDALRYLLAGGRHCCAMAHLLERREVFLSLAPLIRAQLEIYGRLGWFLANTYPDGQRVPGRARVARHHMDVLASLCFRRYSASKRRAPKAAVRKLTAARDGLRGGILTMFPEAHLDWAGPKDELKWSCGGQEYLSLGDGIATFQRVAIPSVRGAYDGLSDLAHPSLVTIAQLAVERDIDEVTHTSLQIERDDIARLVSSAAVFHCRASMLVASWMGVPTNPIDDFLDRIKASTAV